MVAYTVTNNADSGDGSLRAAIMAANAAGGDNTITIQQGVGTILLASNLPLLATSLIITGNGAVIDGAGTYRGFIVSGIAADGQNAAPTTVGISNLNFQNVVAKGGAGAEGGGGGLGAGGAVFVGPAASVTLTHVGLSNARAIGGLGTAYLSPDGVGPGGGGGGLGGSGGAVGGTLSQSQGGGGGGLFFNGGASNGPNGGARAGGGGGGGITSAGGSTSSGTGGNGGAGLGGLGGGGGGRGASSSDPGLGGGTGASAGDTELVTSAGSGGFGGGGGGVFASNGSGAAGGFGGGGGGAFNATGGAGGFGGGGGGTGGGGGQGTMGGFGGGGGNGITAVGIGGFGASGAAPTVGGNGAGLGGAVFVATGGQLTINGTSTETSSSATQGGAATGIGGFGAGIFYEGGTIAAPATLTFGAGDQSYASQIADLNGAAGNNNTDNGLGGTGGVTTLVKVGSGTLTLGGINTYTGGTTITAGTLSTLSTDSGNYNGLGALASTITLNGGTLNFATSGSQAAYILATSQNTTSGITAATGTTASLNFGDFPTTPDPRDFSALNIASGSNLVFGSVTNNGIVVIQTIGNIGANATIEVAGGILRDGSNFLDSYTRTVSKTQVDAGAVLDLNDASTEILNLQSTAGTASVTTGTLTTTVLTLDGGAFAGVISGAGRLTKATADTLTLSGTNNYTGTTTVSAGTVLVDGSLASGSAVAVNAGASLGGAGSSVTTGLINGTVAVSGTLSAGATALSDIGTLTTGALTFANGSTYRVDLNTVTPAADRLLASDVDFDPTAGAAITLDLRVTGALTSAAGQSLTLIDNTGTSTTTSGRFTRVTNNGVDFATISTANNSFSFGGRSYQVSYTGTAAGSSAGNDVTLTDITAAPGGGGGDPTPTGPTAGDDNLTGTGGADNVALLEGNDTFTGGAGADLVYGNLGNDLIYGNQDADVIYGGQGDDRAFGGQGDDRLYGNLGNDVLYGNMGNDIVYGNQGADIVYGNQGADILYGGMGDDVLYGGMGDDILVGGLGNNILVGGVGADRYVFAANPGARDFVLGFNQGEGDRLSLGGQTYTTGTAQNGDALLTLSGGGTVDLAGIRADQVNASFFAA